MKECMKQRPNPTAKFNYAWALIRSKDVCRSFSMCLQNCCLDVASALALLMPFAVGFSCLRARSSDNDVEL